MMLTTSARSAPRARTLQSRRSLRSQSLSSSDATRLATGHQQCRGFRFGHWYSDGCSDSHREARRRHRMFRYRYMESINRRLSWENSPSSGSDATNPQEAFRAAMAQAQNKSGSRPVGSHYNADGTKSSSGDPCLSPGRKNGDGERDAVDPLFGADKTTPYEYDMWKSPLQNIRNFLEAERSPKEVTAEKVLDATTSAEGDRSFIDPITNRRVVKAKAKSGVDDASFAFGYDDLERGRRLMAAQDSARGKRNEPEQKSKPTRDDANAVKTSANSNFKDDASFAFSYEELERGRRLMQAAPDADKEGGKRNDPEGKHTRQETSKAVKSGVKDDASFAFSYKDLERGRRIMQAAENTKANGPEKRNEIKGRRKPTGDEAPKAVKANATSKANSNVEDDGTFTFSYGDLERGRRLMQAAQDTDKNGPEKRHETEKLRTPAVKAYAASDANSAASPKVKDDASFAFGYDDLDRGRRIMQAAHDTDKNGPGKRNEARHHKPSGGDPTAAKTDTKPNVKDDASFAFDYEDLERGRRLMQATQKANEDGSAEGRRAPTSEEGGKKHEGLDKYRAVQWNEPDGLRSLTPEEESKKYDDLAAYDKPFVAKAAAIKAHEASQMDSRPCGQPRPSKLAATTDPEKAYDDLHEYGPVHWNEPDGLRKPTPEELSKNYDDLHRYGPVKWNEPDGLRESSSEDPSKLYEDLSGYGPPGTTRPEVAARIHPEEATKACNDLSEFSYKAVDPNGADGNPSERSGAVDFVTGYPGSRDMSANKPQGGRNRFFSDFTETPVDVVDSLTAQEIRAGVLRKARDNSQKQKQEEVKAESDASWDASAKEAQETVQQARKTPGRKLTGNYARDFPDEFNRSWSTVNSPSKTTLFPKDKVGGTQGGTEAAAGAQGAERADAELSSMDESFPKEEARLEPALDRGATRRSAKKSGSPSQGLPSTSSMGLGTSSKDGKEDWFGPVVAKHYGAKGPKEEPKSTVPPAAEAKHEKPASYKILAYDPTMQTINVAETTSVVHDTSAPLTPADVLLRLSNPSKFFPHFGPLQDEGYEIISGSGDVLVFRKVREGSARGKAARAKATPVNPVDMMGKPPVTGNFASPTGFVNYNEASEGADKPEPPFRSNIDVRREESVFSGARSEGERGGRRKRSLGRKMAMGTVWVAGTAYAVGVLGEYFSTGGLDGLGPRGL